MEKTVLVVADTTEERTKKKIELQKKWKRARISASSHEHAIGVFSGLVPDVILICRAPKSTITLEELKKRISGNQMLFIDGHDQLPATL